jgi:hypothetical protein
MRKISAKQLCKLLSENIYQSPDGKWVGVSIKGEEYEGFGLCGLTLLLEDENLISSKTYDFIENKIAHHRLKRKSGKAFLWATVKGRRDFCRKLYDELNNARQTKQS